MADKYQRIAENRKARHDFHIEETIEAGIALQGRRLNRSA